MEEPSKKEIAESTKELAKKANIKLKITPSLIRTLASDSKTRIEAISKLAKYFIENKSMYDLEEVKNYFSVFNTLLFSYAQKNALNLRTICRDPRVQDVFNRALIHSSSIEFNTTYERSEFADLEELEQRAGPDTKSLEALRKFNSIYREASKRAQDITPGR